MTHALASSVIDALLAVELGGTGQAASNGFSLDGVTLGSEADGALAIGIRTFEAASLRLTSGPLVVEVGRLAVRGIVGQVRIDDATPRLRVLQAADAELSGVKIQGPLIFSPEPNGPVHPRRVQGGRAPGGDTAAGAAADAWCLGPLAAAEGTIRAEIVDAHLLFDADVTVPIRRGEIDFNEATVEHVGPDSSMGVSRLGLYVDAPNGRSYVYQFPATPISGVEFEQRSAFLGAWVAKRGNLRLQAFAEGLLRQALRAPGTGFTEEARVLFERTAVSGDVQLSDGRFMAAGLEADLVGRANGRNAIRVHSKAVGRGLTVEMPSLSVRNAVLNASDTRLACDELEGALVLRVLSKGAQLQLELDVPRIKISGLHVRPGAAYAPSAAAPASAHS
jgi:hypothetical protein